MKNTTFKRLLKMVLLFPLMPIIGIPGEGGAGEGGGTGADSGSKGADGGSGAGKGKDAPAGEKGGTGENGAGKSYSQAEVDALIDKRMAKERAKFDKQLEVIKKAAAGEEPGAGEGGGKDGAGGKSGGDNGAAAAEAVLALANQRLIAAEAAAQAVLLGVDPKFTADLVRLSDLSEVKIDEKGTVDTKTISKALSATLERLPMFKKEQQGSGFRVGGDGQQTGNNNGWGQKQSGQQNTQGNQDTSRRWNRFNR